MKNSIKTKKMSIPIHTLSLVILSSFFLNACGLRAELKKRKQETQDQNEQRAAEKAKEVKKQEKEEEAVIQKKTKEEEAISQKKTKEEEALAQKKAKQEEADLLSEKQNQEVQAAQKEFDLRKNYYTGIEGKYQGQIYATGATSESKLVIKFTIEIATKQDQVHLATITPLTASEIKANTEALASGVSISEESGIRGQTPDTPGTCSIPSLKPELRTGTFTFTCTLSNGRARDYQISLDDTIYNGLEARTPPNMTKRATVISGFLLEGRISKVQSMNVRYKTAFGKDFYGLLERID